MCFVTNNKGIGQLHFNSRDGMQWLKLPAWKVGDRVFEPHSGLQISKKHNVSSSLSCEDPILWGACVTESVWPQCPNFKSCVWRAVSSNSSHHPEEVHLERFSLCVHIHSLVSSEIEME